MIITETGEINTVQLKAVMDKITHNMYFFFRSSSVRLHAQNTVKEFSGYAYF